MEFNNHQNIFDFNHILLGLINGKSSTMGNGDFHSVHMSYFLDVGILNGVFIRGDAHPGKLGLIGAP